MAYTVEDGSIVAGANTYVSVVDAKAYALDRGLELPATDEACQQELVRAADYIDGLYEIRLQGRTVSAAQELAWPRSGVSYDGWAVGQGEIPTQVWQAQVQAAVASHAGVELEPAGSSSPIKREKVGVLETEYQTGSGQGTVIPRVTAVERLMQPFLQHGGRTRTVRA